MKKNNAKKAFLALLTLFGISMTIVSSLETKEPYVVEAASVSKVDSRFFVATTSKPWSYTDYQGDYYSGCNITVTGASLLSNLSSWTAKNYTSSSYDGLKTGLPAVCKFANGQSGMVGFYNRQKISSTWDSGKTWNREHVWPDSRGAGKSGPGSNPFVIMPTSTTINSSRGNNFFGTSGSNTWDPGQYDTQFRGAAARCVLYAAMHYSSTLRLSENPSDGQDMHTMGVKSLLLKWNREYKPDADEMYRNNLTAQKYGARNPFIDYPYLADNIWGSGTSGGDSSSSSSSTSSSSSSESVEKVTYKQIKNVSELTSGKEIVIAGLGSDNKTVYSLSKEIYKDNTPWYLKADKISNNGISSSISVSSEPTLWTLNKDGEIYSFYNEDAGFLKSYVSSNHYSIGLTKVPGTVSSEEGTNDWNVSFDSNGTVTLKSSANVYLGFVNSSNYTEFKGGSASNKLYLFEKEKELTPLTEAESFAKRFLSEIRPNCTDIQKNSDKPSASLLASWKKMNEDANKLSRSAKSLLKQDNPSSESIRSCVELYEYICLKYDSSLNASGGDFLGRFGTNPKLRGNVSIERKLSKVLWAAVLGAIVVLTTFGILSVALSKKKRRKA